MHRRNLPIRTRTAIWIALIAAAMLITMGFAVQAIFGKQLQANLDDILTLRAEANRQLIDTTQNPPTLVVTHDPNQELLTGVAVLRLYAADGTLLDDASPASGVTAEERHVVTAALGANRPVFRTVDLAGDEDYRIVASPIVDGASPGLVLVTGLEQARIAGPLRILRIILAFAVPLTVLSLALGAYWVTRRALAPITQMVTAANLVAIGDLNQRVPGSIANDELGFLARTLNDMIDRLDATVARERRFTADAAHELRTPLAAIEAGIDVTLSEPRDSDEYRRVLEVVRGQSTRLERLANQLLLLARLDTGEIREWFVLVDLIGLLDAVTTAFSEAHPDASIELTSASGSLDIEGNVELLARAIMNVMENALSHAGPTVRIHIDASVRNASVAEISIQDDGRGIPEEQRDLVFRRFHRGDAARTGSGTGLGLSIVAAIIQAHGGEAMAEEPLAGWTGAHVVVRLPLVTGKVNDADPSAS